MKISNKLWGVYSTWVCKLHTESNQLTHILLGLGMSETKKNNEKKNFNHNLRCLYLLKLHVTAGSGQPWRGSQYRDPPGTLTNLVGSQKKFIFQKKISKNHWPLISNSIPRPWKFWIKTYSKVCAPPKCASYTPNPTNSLTFYLHWTWVTLENKFQTSSEVCKPPECASYIPNLTNSFTFYLDWE
jgi:hypothetical protein